MEKKLLDLLLFRLIFVSIRNRMVYFMAIVLLISLNTHAQTITDIDGNVYNTVEIGTQTWMQENLKTTRFNNGIEIPTTSSPVTNDTTALYQWAYDDDIDNINIYGRLYTWNVVNSNNNVCPVGWKVPDSSDWDTLMDFLGGELVAGGKMKEVGTTHWVETDSTLTNSSGFTGLGGGTRGNPSGFSNLGQLGSFWSSTPFGSLIFPRGTAYNLAADNNSLQRSVAVAQNGKSIRCIEGATTSTQNSTFEHRIQVYPNPVTDILTIAFDEVKNCQLFIYDMMGNALYKQDLVDQTNDLPIAFLPKGTYLMQLVAENRVFSYKFIKQ